MKKLVLLAAFVVSLTGVASADEIVGARVDISSNGKNRVELTPVNAKGFSHISNVPWGSVNDRKYALTVDLKPVRNDGTWHNMTFKFLPKSSGDVIITIKGNWIAKPKGQKELPQGWVLFDDITLTGGKIFNGGFEEKIIDEIIPGWKRKAADHIVSGKDNAAEGRNAVKVCFKYNMWQRIKVKANVEVTFSAKVKYAEYIANPEK